MYAIKFHWICFKILIYSLFKPGLLASGGSESDIWIWDLNKASEPLTPGSKSKPPDDVTCVAWNRQVQHILASTYAGRWERKYLKDLWN